VPRTKFWLQFAVLPSLETCQQMIGIFFLLPLFQYHVKAKQLLLGNAHARQARVAVPKLVCKATYASFRLILQTLFESQTHAFRKAYFFVLHSY